MICVIAKLAPDAAERLNSLREAVIPDKLPAKPLYAHITVATYLPDDDTFPRACSEIIRETPAFPVRYEKLEVLSATSAIVAVPSKPEALLTLHDSIARKFSKSLDRWTGGTDWYPHTTLLYNPNADLNALCREMRKHLIPFETSVSRIEFSKVEETGYTILESINLKQ